MDRLTNLPVCRSLCLTLLLASGCTILTPSPTPTPTPPPTLTIPPSPTPTSAPTPEPPDTGWQPLQPGVELRHVLVASDASAPPTGTSTNERVSIVRLDPSTARFRVHYDPAEPLPVSGWARRLGHPLVVINGGYFTPENQTTGLLISDGKKWGSVYGDYAGLFAVTSSGQVGVRWLKNHPYDPVEPLTQGVMSFPVLVKPGGVMGFPADADAGTPARRTVVAQDQGGLILLMVAPRGHLSLHRLACFLAESDMGIDVALNLDGGYSTGLWLETDAGSEKIDSSVDVPSVISVEGRDDA
jgi:uncharacterized protein YigE (DUF2233 family)